MKVTAMVHSKEKREEVEIIGKNYKGWDGTEYIVLTKDGVKCTAIYNPFVGIYYADDIYGIIKEER